MSAASFFAVCEATIVLTAALLTTADGEESSADRGRKFPQEYPAREECFARSHVLIEGQHLFQQPLAVDTPDACCSECRSREKCVAWIYRGCCDYCSLLSHVSEMRACHTSDCVSGITDERYRYVEDNYWQASPRERFRGLITTCEQSERYTLTSVVLSACGEVQRRCAPALNIEESKPLEPVRHTCHMVPNTNYWGSDYNDGYSEQELSAEQCCHACLRDRGCRAWTRTAGGQCFKKWRVPPEEDWILNTPGSVAGKKIDWDVTCGDTVRGVAYDIANPDEKNESNATSADACCQLCRKAESCVVWSFIGGYLCRELRSYSIRPERDPDAISAYIITKPLDCGRQSIEDVATPLRIAEAYRPECASILIHGPGIGRRRCSDREAANRIFNETVHRIRQYV